MEIDRRTFAVGSLFMVAPLLHGQPVLSADPDRNGPRIASTVRRPDGSFAAVLYDLERGLIDHAVLPARGHDVTANPMTGEVVAFARRPGTFAVAFGCRQRHPPVAFGTPPGRHFYGHGVFSPDGKLLYTTENDTTSGQGIIGVWDAAARYRRVAEMPAGGIGPHDINMLQDGRTLVVANGGLRTHPDHGRRPLNIATMQPSLAYVDRLTGNLLDRQRLPAVLNKLSIRHLEVAAKDTVVFGCQFKGPKTEFVDLIGFHRHGEKIALLPTSPAIHRALRHYVSSIAVDRNGAIAAVTSSRGQQAVFIDVERRSVCHIRSFPDVSGVASASGKNGFVLTGGGGDVAVVASATTPASAPGARKRARWAWDNHAVAIACSVSDT